MRLKFFLVFILVMHLPLRGDRYIPEYLWNLGFAIAADKTPFSDGLPYNYGSLSHGDFVDPRRYIHHVKEGDIIWVQRACLHIFCEHVLPHIRARFVLIINDGDLSFPSPRYDPFDTKKLMKDSRVIAVFAQNIDSTYFHPKMHYLPIGLDFHSVSREKGYFGEPHASVQEQEILLNEMLSTFLPTHERKKRVLIDFCHNDFNAYGDSRTEIINKLSPLPFVDMRVFLPRHTLWRVKGEYAFAISPHGFGLDCHRTWEGLVCGNIVIVKTSSLDPMYEGLPVVIVKDWSEVNESNLDKWLEKYKDAFTNPQYRFRLTHVYWMNKIRKAAQDR